LEGNSATIIDACVSIGNRIAAIVYNFQVSGPVAAIESGDWLVFPQVSVSHEVIIAIVIVVDAFYDPVQGEESLD
jgi:hypothetical protein